MDAQKLDEFIRLYKETRRHWLRERCLCVLCRRFMKLGDELFITS